MTRARTHPLPPAAEARRRWLRQSGAAGLALGGWARGLALPAEPLRAHFPFGPVEPARPIPPWPVATHRGQATTLDALLRGRTTALQWMFTGCSATCPIQGALFAQAQLALGQDRGALQLVSLSIDPLGDTPAALAAWLRRFGAADAWLGAVPRIDDVDRIIALLGTGGDRRPVGTDPHTGQVFIIDRHVELAYRTTALPPAGDIVTAMHAVSRHTR